MPRTGLSAAELRSRAIDVALARVEREGYDKVRVKDVARALGVSHAALYIHFEDRAALLDAATARWLTEIERVLQAICDADEPALVRIERWFCTRYRRKRQRALADPQIFESFDAAAAIRKPYCQDHLATIQHQVESLLVEAALPTGTPAEQAILLLEATRAFYHPTLTLESLDHDGEPMLRRILAHMLAAMSAPMV